jgi:hypothetical protein
VPNAENRHMRLVGQPKRILGAIVERRAGVNGARGRIESCRKRGLPLWGHAVDDADELAEAAE